MSRSVLITGGAGFIGSNLARRLVAGGDRVRILDDLSVGHPGYLAGVPHELVVASLADREAVGQAVDGMDAIVHLAARAGIPDSVADPLASFEVNVAGLVGVLEAARLAGARRFVFASSNAAAGEGDARPGNHELNLPASPYGASKLAGEAYCHAYASTYGLAACSLRFSNAYGPRSLHKKSVVAAWLRAAFDGQPIAIHGDGEQTRDFVFVDDLAAAVSATLEGPEDRIAGQVFHVGTGVETTVNELAAAVQSAVGRPVAIQRLPARAGDVRRNVASVEEAEQRLGYRAAIPLAEGMARTAAWFQVALADPALTEIVPVAASGSE